LLAGALAALPTQWAQAQTGRDAALQISWEVRNRFRLFREERDFLLHVESARDRSILASEQGLELQSDGRGWARNMVNRLCIDLSGRVNEPCTRDNVKESYLTPIDHPITVRLTGAVPVGGQLAELRDAVAAAKRRQPDRKLDLVMLSIGANDIYFSGLVADVIVDTVTERALFRRTGVMASVDDSRAALARDLPQSFA